jgi:hypothetical protein
VKSTIEKDRQVFQQVTAEMEAEGFFDRWLGQVSKQPITSSAKHPIASEAQPADSNADKEPDETGSVLKEEG